MPTDIIWLEALPQAVVRLRVYTPQLERPCMHDEPWGHDATSGPVAQVPLEFNERGGYPHDYPNPEEFGGHAAWPTQCSNGSCDYLFQLADIRQVYQEQLFKRSDTGELLVQRDFPAGACWDAAWRTPQLPYGDGLCVYVRLPGGHDWCVDAESTNCTRKGQPHHCWVRHGDPRQPSTLHVDKQGDTCQAGGGSISVPGYHGFLHHGQLGDHLG